MIKIVLNPNNSSLKDIKHLSNTSWQELTLEYNSKEEKYEWIVLVLNSFSYRSLRKKDKSIIIKFLAQVTNHKVEYIHVLIHKYLSFKLKVKKYTRKKPHRKYGIRDIKLLAETDAIHKRLSASATKTIFEREVNVYGNKNFKNLARISVSHINNLRKSTGYDCIYKNGTKPSQVSIGETKKPEANGRPGSIRVDTIHQRDVYYINAVDEVTQWELIHCVPKISEMYLVPIFKNMLRSFPFKVFNFHSDRGSEFINHTVKKILERLLIRQTKSRSRHCNDNALIEMKNGFIVRKHLGYGFIADVLAPTINHFLERYMNEYLNFHRPCGYRTGKRKSNISKRTYYKYGEYKTPYEKLKSISKAEKYLIVGVTFEKLDKIAMRMSDNEFARLLTKKKVDLFSKINQGRYGQFSVPDFHP